jgi:surfeit locus 1 family protein
LSGPVEIVGLLRVTEPKGRFLRSNRPEQGRWYSRDVQAIAKSRGLANVAPFFIDADSRPNPGALPIGGMTVVAFRNMHLVYALTWFALALLCLAGLVVLFRRER